MYGAYGNNGLINLLEMKPKTPVDPESRISSITNTCLVDWGGRLNHEFSTNYPIKAISCIVNLLESIDKEHAFE